MAHYNDSSILDKADAYHALITRKFLAYAPYPHTVILPHVRYLTQGIGILEP